MKCTRCETEMDKKPALAYIKVEGYGSICVIPTSKFVCPTCEYEVLLLTVENSGGVVDIKGDNFDG